MIMVLSSLGRSLLFLLLFASFDGAALSADRSIGIARGPDNEATATPLGLSAKLDRTDLVYVVGDHMTLDITTTRPAAIRLWEIYPDGQIGHIGAGCVMTKANTPLRFPAPGQRITIGRPLGITELHIQAIDPARSSGLCRVLNGARSIGDPADRLAWRSQIQEIIVRYRVVQF
jgi:hypothetical protein